MKHLCIYAKPPIPGRAKSRLAEDIGAEAAADLAAALLKDLYRELLGMPGVEISLWHTPESQPEEFLGVVPESTTFAVQEGANLGDRMRNTCAGLLRESDNQVVIIGTDCIFHSKGSIAEAFRLLEGANVVLQPAEDGGYVLVGQSQFCGEMFDGVEWGTEKVFAQTLSKLDRSDCSYCLMPMTFDIDVQDDLSRLVEGLDPGRHLHTSAWVERTLA